MLKAKILKAGIEQEGTVLVLGFVGEGVGVVRAICVDPVTGNARAHALHEVIFQPLASAEPSELAALTEKLNPPAAVPDQEQYGLDPMTKALQNAKMPEFPDLAKLPGVVSYADEPTEENTAPDKPMDHTRPPWRQGKKT